MQNVRAIARALLIWFDHAARDLPWRRTRDPYGIWVAEVMLQQTQVKTVEPYWQRWMRALPTVRALARAQPDQLLKLWEGLGYYSRARNLQRAAQVIVREHAGQVPRDFTQLIALPGIGRYTAGAIASIAFNQPTPVLDGNVTRVLTRLFAVTKNPSERATNQHLWGLAEALVQVAARLPGIANCGQLNQALMELGALVCLPRAPECGECPLHRLCSARREGLVEMLPRPRPRPSTIHQTSVVFVVHRRGRLCVRQRPAGKVNGHLWEFPNLPGPLGKSELHAAVQRLLGATPVAVEKLGQLTHSITRHRIRVEVFAVRFAPHAKLSVPAGQWRSPAELGQLPFTAAHRRIVRLATSKA